MASNKDVMMDHAEYVNERCNSLPDPRVLYKSDNFLCIDKQYDVKINSDNPSEMTLEHQVRKIFPELSDPKCKHGYRFIHRLDFATSGILTLGLNKNAAKHLSWNFKYKKVVKYYIALVRGHIKDNIIFIDVATGDLDDHEWRGRRCAANHVQCSDPRYTQTLLVCLDKGTYNKEPATKVLLKPITGRQHQLRVHCDYIGHTIVGDYTYSLRQDTKPSRMMLHSHRLMTNMDIETLDITSPDPFTNKTLTEWESGDVCMTYDDAVELARKFDPNVACDGVKRVHLDCNVTDKPP